MKGGVYRMLTLGRVAVCFPVLDSVAVGHAITYASHLDSLRLPHESESEEDG